MIQSGVPGLRSLLLSQVMVHLKQCRCIRSHHVVLEEIDSMHDQVDIDFIEILALEHWLFYGMCIYRLL